jgi:hypothetical protein
MACDIERTNLANAAADMALAMATEAADYASYIVSMMATYAAMANWSVALWALEQCENGQNMRSSANHEQLEVAEEQLRERTNCVSHGLKLLQKIDTSGLMRDGASASSRQLAAAREKLAHAVRSAV